MQIQFLKNFFNKTIKYDMINKFRYNSSKKIPCITTSVLHIKCKTTDIHKLASSLLALNLISQQNGIMTKAKKPLLLLKIRKGNPKGCKTRLTKKQTFYFFENIITDIFPRLKTVIKINLENKINKTLSYHTKEISIFPEVEANFYVFQTLSDLDVNIATNSNKKIELVFLLKSLQQLPYK